MAKRIALLVAMLCLGVMLAGCHTVKGIGQDIGAGGEAIERSSGQ